MNKVVILSLHLAHGGVENYICHLANMLVDTNEVTIVCSYQLGKPAYFIDERVHIEYLKENLKPNKHELKSAMHGFHPIRLLKEGIRSMHILHLRNSLMKKKIQSLSNCTIVSTRIIYDMMIKKTKNKNVITILQEHNDRSQNEKYLKKLKKCAIEFDYFMASSELLTKLYEDKLQINDLPFVYLPLPVEEGSGQYSDMQNNNLIAVGRLSQEKGFLDLIDVMELVHQKMPNVHLDLIGDGDEREYLESQIRQKELDSVVTLHGFLDHDKVASFYQKSDLYVMCSHEESFGLVLIEAETYGVPLIAFDSALGANEIIKNGQNGFLIENRDKQKMAQTILDYLTDEALKKRMQVQAMNHAKNYQIDRLKPIYQDFFETIRGGKGNL